MGRAALGKKSVVCTAEVTSSNWSSLYAVLYDNPAKYQLLYYYAYPRNNLAKYVSSHLCYRINLFNGTQKKKLLFREFSLMPKLDNAKYLELWSFRQRANDPDRMTVFRDGEFVHGPKWSFMTLLREEKCFADRSQ